ncbi:MAG: FlgD immunoglobulin-like domain containing protein, partial [Dehalococcoidia bacterium]
ETHAQWVLTNAPEGIYVYAFAISDTNVFAGADTDALVASGGSVFLSTNNGMDWTNISTGLTAPEVRALAVSDTNIFAGTWGDGVFHSTDNGANWTEVNTGLPSPLYGVRLAISGTNIFAGAAGGVFLSTNNGANWTDVSNGLPNLWVFDLAASDTNVFALTNWGGVSLSTDNGANWALVNEGLIDTLVLAIAVSDSFIFAGGTSGSGVWRRALSEMIVSVEDVAGSLPSSFNLAQNYPNPFNPSTTLGYELPARAVVVLTIHDLLGRRVRRLVQGVEGPGYQSAVWDGTDDRGRPVSSGVYLYRIQAGPPAGGFTQTRKMVLLR